MDQTYQIGDRIIATSPDLNGQIGTVKWYGQIQGVKGNWYGVELDNEVGKHDGKVKGVVYFECRPKCGIFLKEKHMIEHVAPPQNTGGEKAPEEAAEEKPKEEETKQEEPEEKKEEEKTEEKTETKSPEKSEKEGEDSEEQQQEEGQETIQEEDEQENEEEGSGEEATADKKSNLKSKIGALTGKKVTSTVSKTGTEKKTPATASKVGSTTSKTGTATKTTATPGVRSGTRAKTVKEESKVASSGLKKTVTKIGGSKAKDGDGESEQLKEQIKSLENDLEAKDQEIADKVAENEGLLKENEEIKEKLETVNKEKDQVESDLAQTNNKLNDLEREMQKFIDDAVHEYKEKYREAHSKLAQLTKEKKEFELQNRKLQKEVESAQNNEEMMELMVLEKDEVKAELEEAKDRVKELEEKVTQLKDEMELQQLEFEDAMEKVENQEVGELNLENTKLKNAIQNLYTQLENVKKHSAEQVEKMEKRVADVPQIEEKNKEIKRLQDEIKRLNVDAEEFKFRLDDYEDSAQMIEKLSEDVLNKDDELIDLRKELMKYKKDQEGDALLISEYEDFIKTLEGDLASREVDIQNLRTTVEEANTTIGNLEKNITRYKEKIQSLSEDLQFYKEQDTEDKEARFVNRIDELSKKHLEAVNQFRESEKEKIEALLEKILAKNETMRYSVMVNVLPKNLKDKMHFGSLQKFFNLLHLKEKVALLSNCLASKYLKDIYHAKENIELISWIKELLFDLADLTFYCNIIEMKFNSFEGEKGVESYIEFAKAPLFNQLLAINSIMDQLFNHLKEDTLSVKFHLDTLKLVLGKICEISQEYEYQLECSHLKIKKLIDQNVANGLDFYCIGVNKDVKFENLSKYIERFDDFATKLDLQNVPEDEEDLDMTMADAIEALMMLKLDVSTKASELKTAEEANEFNTSEIEEGFEKAISRLQALNLKSKPDDQLQNIIKKGPWNEINSGLRGEIEQVSELAINYDRATQQLKEQIKSNLMQQNEIKDLTNIKSTLEKRVADLQLKAEKAAQLDIEVKRLRDREAHFTDASDKVKAKLEETKKKLEKVEEENAKLKGGEGAGGSSTAAQLLQKISTRGSAGQSMKPKFGVTSAGVTEEIGGVVDEDYENIISKLRKESVNLRGEAIKRRAQNMESKMPEFIKFMKAQENSSSFEDFEGEGSKLSGLVQQLKTVEDMSKKSLCGTKIVSLKEFKAQTKDERHKTIKSNLDANDQAIQEKVSVLSGHFTNTLTQIENTKSFKAYLDPQLQASSGSNQGNLFASIKLKDFTGFKNNVLSLNSEYYQRFKRELMA